MTTTEIAEATSKSGSARLWDARWSIAGAAVLLMFCGVWLALRVVLPGDGAPWLPDRGFNGGITLGAATSGGALGLHAGDVVDGVDGLPLDHWLNRATSRPPLAEGVHLTYQLRRGGRLRDIQVVLGTGEPVSGGLRRDGPVGIAALGLIALGGFIVTRRPDHPAARGLLLVGASIAATFTFNTIGLEVGHLVTAPWLFLMGLVGLVAGTAVMVTSLAYLVLTFPSPPTVLRRRPWLIGCLYGAGLAGAVGVASYVLAGRVTVSGLHRWDDALTSIYDAMSVLVLAGIVRTALLARRHVAVRRQLALVGVALGVLVVGLITINVVSPNQPAPPWILATLFVPLPVAVAVALLRGELLDIRATLNRAVSFAALSAALLGVYATVVALVGLVVGSTGLVASLPATAVVAMAFAPTRARSQRAVERLFYGDRGQPANVLSELSRRLETAVPAQDLLATVAETVAQTLRLPYVGIVDAADTSRVACERGQRPETVIRVPLVHQGEAVGQLLVGPRPGERSLGPTDRTLLADIGRQVATTLRATSLLTDLAASKDRLAVAREEERARLRHDLHDRVGARLAGLALRLDTTATAANGSAMSESLQHACAEADAALNEVRRLARGLRPADLDQLGLVAAVEAAATRLTVTDDRATWRTDVVAAIHLPVLAPVVEAAAYHIALEAITNAHRHSGGRQAQVRIGIDPSGTTLVIEIADDGHGISLTTEVGVGLHSMRERAANAGGSLDIGTTEHGGTLVRAELPVTPRQFQPAESDAK
jgi:signal transduction histidine kinase